MTTVNDQSPKRELEPIDWAAYGPCTTSTCYVGTGTPCRDLNDEERGMPHRGRSTLAALGERMAAGPKPTAMQRLAAQQAIDEMTGPAVSVDRYRIDEGAATVQRLLADDTGLPSPDHHAVAAAHVPPARAFLGEPPCSDPACLCRQPEEHARLLADASRRHAEASPRTYTAPLTLPADCVEIGWLVLDARNEQTWHAVTAVTDCANPACEVARVLPLDHECVVLVGGAWADGHAHFRDDERVDVRIPAGER